MHVGVYYRWQRVEQGGMVRFGSLVGVPAAHTPLTFDALLPGGGALAVLATLQERTVPVVLRLLCGAFKRNAGQTSCRRQGIACWAQPCLCAEVACSAFCLYDPVHGDDLGWCTHEPSLHETGSLLYCMNRGPRPFEGLTKCILSAGPRQLRPCALDEACWSWWLRCQS